MADHKGGHDLRKQIHLTDKAEIAGIVLKTVNDETIDNTDTTEINLNVTNTTQTSETETGDNSDILSVGGNNNNTEGRNGNGENPMGAARVTGPAESTVMSRDQPTTAAGHSNDVTISMFQQLMQCMQQNMENLNEMKQSQNETKQNLNEMKQSQNEMKQSQNEMKQNLNGMKQEIRQDIHRIEENYRELKDTFKSDIKECQTVLGNQISFVYNNTQKWFKTEIAKEDVTQQNQNEMRLELVNNTEESNDKMERNLNEMKHEMYGMKPDLINKTEQNYNETKEEVKLLRQEQDNSENPEEIKCSNETFQEGISQQQPPETYQPDDTPTDADKTQNDYIDPEPSSQEPKTQQPKLYHPYNPLKLHYRRSRPTYQPYFTHPQFRQLRTKHPGSKSRHNPRDNNAIPTKTPDRKTYNHIFKPVPKKNKKKKTSHSTPEQYPVRRKLEENVPSQYGEPILIPIIAPALHGD